MKNAVWVEEARRVMQKSTSRSSAHCPRVRRNAAASITDVMQHFPCPSFFVVVFSAIKHLDSFSTLYACHCRSLPNLPAAALETNAAVRTFPSPCWADVVTMAPASLQWPRHTTTSPSTDHQQPDIYHTFPQDLATTLSDTYRAALPAKAHLGTVQPQQRSSTWPIFDS